MNRLKYFIYVVLVISLIIPSFYQSDTVYANTSWQPVNFVKYEKSSLDGAVEEGYEEVAYVVPQTSIEMWHHSGKYWQYTTPNGRSVRINDSEITNMIRGRLSGGALNNIIEVSTEHPSEIKQYLNNGGSLEDIQMIFVVGYGTHGGLIKPEDIFETAEYSVDGSYVHFKYKPIYNVDQLPFYDSDNMNVTIPHIAEGFGDMVTSLWAVNGSRHYGAGRSRAVWGYTHPVTSDHIADHTGRLKPGMYSYNGLGHERGGVIPPGTAPHTDIKIGEGNTFAGGGAVGLSFLYPVRVIYYMDGRPLPPPPQMCTIGGQGSSMGYEDLVCETGPDGETVCWCEGRTAYLHHEARVNYDDNRQTLLGVWSKNSLGHHTLDVPYAYGANLPSQNFRIEIRNHGVPGVDRLKRVIRAGRPVQMYGTIQVELSIMNFEDTDGLKSRRDSFIRHLISTLEAHGVDVGYGEVKNHLGQTVVKASNDPSRLRSGSFIEEWESRVSSTRFGSPSCTQITRYHQEFRVTIPIRTINEGGKQETHQGDFAIEDSYNVRSAMDDFTANINNMNGIYGLRFQTELSGNAIDSSLNRNGLCRSNVEKFGIQGNIYDDVRSEPNPVNPGNPTPPKDDGRWDW